MRRHYIFSGHVQGVGFRWRARQAAEHYGVAGYVRNLYDGSVEMEAEGSEEDIDSMILAIEQSRYIDITDIRVKQIEEKGDRYFDIK